MKRLVGLAFLIGCTNGPPVNVAGNYSIAITNRDNGCNFASYNVGDTAANIPVVITQNGAAATATVNGVAAISLDLQLGTNVFTGTVDGNGLDLKLQGTRAFTMGNCAFTHNSDIIATLVGDALSGQVRYTAATNNNSDCATLQSCLTYQDFNGTRPPQ